MQIKVIITGVIKEFLSPKLDLQSLIALSMTHAPSKSFVQYFHERYD